MESPTTPTWRLTLRAGDRIDALDTERKWYEAQVISRLTDSVLVHYRSWDTKWDEWLSLQSPRIAPAYSYVRRWRALDLGCGVQLRVPLLGGKSAWRDGVVQDLKLSDCGDGTKAKQVLVKLAGDARLRWVSTDDEYLCAPNTHKAVPANRSVLADDDGAIVQPRTSYTTNPTAGKTSVYVLPPPKTTTASTNRATTMKASASAVVKAAAPACVVTATSVQPPPVAASVVAATTVQPPPQIKIEQAPNATSDSSIETNDNDTTARPTVPANPSLRDCHEQIKRKANKALGVLEVWELNLKQQLLLMAEWKRDLSEQLELVDELEKADVASQGDQSKKRARHN